MFKKGKYHVGACLSSQIVKLGCVDAVVNSLLDFENDQIEVDVLEIKSKRQIFKSSSNDGDVERFFSSLSGSNVIVFGFGIVFHLKL